MTDNTHTDNEEPTKSSGELEDLLVFRAALNGLKRGGVKDTTRFEATWKRQLLSYITTQTTKLQAEARLDEHNLYHKEVAECMSEGTPGVDDLIERGYLEQYHDTRVAQLGREHKIGEDGE